MTMKNGRITRMKQTKTIISVVVAFAMAITLLPAADVFAGNQSEEPTLPACEMDESGTPEDTETVGEQPGEEETVETTSETEEQDTVAAAADTETTVTEPTTAAPTTTQTTAPTTTINPAGNGWKTPKGKKALFLTLCCNTDGSWFDLTTQAGQKLYGYDTLQGAAAGKGYGYFALYNRKNNRAKIVKVNLANMAVVKVSAAMDLKHANDLTYNGRKNIIVVANSDPKAKRLSVIDANTLALQYHKTIKVSKKVSGMSKKMRKKFKGVGAIAYNEKHNCYICRTRKTNYLLFLNANLKPYKLVKQKRRISGMLYQGLDSYQDCIMVCQSFKGKKKYNAITVYNMKGKYLARFKMSVGKPAPELETIFHNGSQFYAGFYMCYGAKVDEQKLGIVRKNLVYRINNL